MKKINLAVLTIAVTSSLLVAQNRYGEKSGIIEYEISGGGKVMGVDTKITGNSTQYFKNYGNTLLTKEKTSQTTMGTTQVEEDIFKLVDDTIYSVDLDKKIIFKMKLDGKMKELGMLSANKEDLIKNGGKKIGSETVAGYTCDNWDLKNEKLCVYKGIPLKITSTQMGLTHIQKATSVKFESVNEDMFTLPQYPEKNQADMMQDMKKQMAQEMKNATPEERKMMQDMMQKLMESPNGAVLNQ